MKLLVVEDDPKIATAVKRGLEGEGFTVDVATDGDDGWWMATEGTYDLLVLDIMLPRRNGYVLCADLRRAGDWTPILMLTAKDGDLDEAEALDTGADDYLTKPFDLHELVLRLRALDRRRVHARPPVLEIAGLRLDPFRREVFRDGRYVALTRKQFAVLEVLVAAGGGVISAEELLERAWDENADPFTNAVRITVSALRKRLGEPWVIATVPGVGYRIDAGAEAAAADREE